MALPSTNITTTLVGQELGLNTHNVSTLCLSSLVNEYGFNSPDYKEQSAYFGKTPYQRQNENQTVFPKQGYPLGVFRNYDHNWITFTGNNGYKTSDSINYYSPIYMRLPIVYAKEDMSTKTPVTIAHTFDVYFNRYGNDFVHTNFVKMISDQTGYYPYFQFQINPQSPPDGGSALTVGSTAWFKVVHKSSPDRRWISGIDAISNNGDGECYIFSVVIPSDPWTNSMRYTDLTFFAYRKTGNSGIIASLNILGDLRVQNNNVNIKFEIASDSNFTTNEFLTNTSATCNANTTSPGTSVQSGSAYFDLSSAISKFSVGSTIYYRVNFNNDGWSQTYSAIVSNQPPLQ
jgi:hypothetical protein